MQSTPKQLRSFGLTVGGIFAIIGLWPVLFYGQNLRLLAVVLAGLLILPAIVFPHILATVYRGWMAVGQVLGFINTRIILGIIFYGLVTPIGLLRRLWAKDPMGRRFRPDLESYRVMRKPRPASHMRQQF
jgi:hypothetical protein